jgi:hypothetical protein
MSKATELRELASLTTISSGQIQFDTDIKISGDLITTGNTITITADTLNISDPNITLASGAANNTVADGAGITIDGADATLTYDAGGDSWVMNKDLTVGPFDFDIATDRLTITNNTNTGGIDIVGNNGRIYFGGLRAFEGTSTGNLSIGEGFANIYLLDNTSVVGTSLQVADSGGTNYVKHNIYGGTGFGGNGTGSRYVGTLSNEEMTVRQNNINTIYIERGTRNVAIGDAVANTDATHTLSVKGELNVVDAISTNQVRHAIRPTLNLDFANSKTLDPRITFYRDSVATYYDSKGTLRYANHNEPRFDHDPVTGESKGLLIEEAKTNIASAYDIGLPLTYNGTVMGSRNADVAPDGTYSAHQILAIGGVGRHEVNIKYEGTDGVTYTISTWVKPLGNVTHINLSRAGGSAKACYNLTGDGSIEVLEGGASATINAFDNDWYKLTITYTELGTGTKSTYMSPGIGTNSSSVYSNLDGNGINGVMLWGEQVEVSPFPTSYIPSDTRFTSRSSVATYHDETGILRTASANSPRYGYKYDGRKWVETGLILESAATNYLPDSSNHGGGYNCSVDKYTTEITSPDGAYMAMKLYSTDSSIFNYKTFSIGNNSLNGYVITASFYLKMGTERYAWLSFSNANGTPNGEPNGTFDLQTGTIARTGDLDHMAIENVGDGWYRCSITHLIDGTPTINQAVISLANTNSGRSSSGSIYIAYPQLEVGYVATSAIDTTGVNGSVTRSADVVSSTAYTRRADFAHIIRKDELDFYNEDAGTLYYEVSSNKPTSDTGGGRLGFSYDGSNDNRWMVNVNSTSYDAYIQADGQTSVNITGTAPGAGVMHKSAIAATSNDAVVYQNGVIEGSDSSVVMPKINQFRLYNPTGDTDFMCGHFKKVAYYPERLSNAELQALTENN